MVMQNLSAAQLVHSFEDLSEGALAKDHRLAS